MAFDGKAPGEESDRRQRLNPEEFTAQWSRKEGKFFDELIDVQSVEDFLKFCQERDDVTLNGRVSWCTDTHLESKGLEQHLDNELSKLPKFFVSAYDRQLNSQERQLKASEGVTAEMMIKDLCGEEYEEGEFAVWLKGFLSDKNIEEVAEKMRESLTESET